MRLEQPVAVKVYTAVDKNNSLSHVRAATAIFTEHGELIRTAIAIHTHGRADIEDLYQEFYLGLIRRPIPADVQNVEGYLFRAVAHHVVDAIRRQRTYSKKVKEYAQETQNSVHIREAGNACIVNEQKNATMVHLARTLRAREAQAFLLRYRDRCSIVEIATRMGVTTRTVSRYLTGGLRKLRRGLAPE